MEQVLREILTAALAAADPAAVVRRFLVVEDGHVRIGERRYDPARLVALAVGKAASAMALAAEEALGESIAAGLVVTRAGYDRPVRRFDTVIGDHPDPGRRSLEAARRVINLVSALQHDDLLLVLLSGGASALLADSATGIDLRHLATLTQALIKSGASIQEINAVRKHISTLKGGGLARLARPATVVALLLSDVVGDDPSAIGSGLTAPDPTTLAVVAAILQRYRIAVPDAVRAYLATAPETLKPGDPVFERVINVVVGSGRLSTEAAAARAAELGYAPLILSTYITGPAQDAARLYSAIIREILASGHPLPAPCALISSGESTVVVTGEGTGGPNQEFVLALALELDGVEGWSALAVDTDGVDGPTNAAGGLVGGATAGLIRRQGRDPAAALRDNDAYPALQAAGALLITGPTGTNVNDLRVALVTGGGDGSADRGR